MRARVRDRHRLVSVAVLSLGGGTIPPGVRKPVGYMFSVGFELTACETLLLQENRIRLASAEGRMTRTAMAAYGFVP